MPAKPPAFQFGIAHAGYVITLLVAVFGYAFSESRKSAASERSLEDLRDQRAALIHARDRETDDLKARLARIEQKNCDR
jgi:Skp family chaperone for outer membrane proteins